MLGVMVGFTGELFLTVRSLPEGVHLQEGLLRMEAEKLKARRQGADTHGPVSFFFCVLTVDACSKYVPINHCPVVPREESYPRVWEKPWREGMKARH